MYGNREKRDGKFHVHTAYKISKSHGTGSGRSAQPKIGDTVKCIMTKLHTKYQNILMNGNREKCDRNSDGRTDGRTEGRTDGQGECSIPPTLEWGYNMVKLKMKCAGQLEYTETK